MDQLRGVIEALIRGRNDHRLEVTPEGRALVQSLVQGSRVVSIPIVTTNTTVPAGGDVRFNLGQSAGGYNFADFPFAMVTARFTASHQFQVRVELRASSATASAVEGRLLDIEQTATSIDWGSLQRIPLAVGSRFLQIVIANPGQEDRTLARMDLHLFPV